MHQGFGVHRNFISSEDKVLQFTVPHSERPCIINDFSKPQIGECAGSIQFSINTFSLRLSIVLSYCRILRNLQIIFDIIGNISNVRRTLILRIKLLDFLIGAGDYETPKFLANYQSERSTELMKPHNIILHHHHRKFCCVP